MIGGEESRGRGLGGMLAMLGIFETKAGENHVIQ